jgi:hypothetical protein
MFEGVYSAGDSAGTALGHYLVWLGQIAAAKGAKRLFFLSREGAWLAKHYDALRCQHSEGDQWPPPVTLAVSRLSTFLPSLSSMSEGALAPLLAQYNDADCRTVLGSLGVGVPLRTATHLPLDEPWRGGAGAHVLADPVIYDLLQSRRLAQREALLGYLEQQGVLREATLAVADLGWRGSIQDNLARLLPGKSISGFYLALQAPLATQPPNSAKSGFILNPDDPSRLARRLRFVAPLEFLASDERPSTRSYAFEEGRAVPVADELVIVPVHDPFFVALQAGITAGITRAATQREPSADIARNLLLRFLEAPPPDVARVFFRAYRDDRFGAGRVQQGAPKITPGHVIQALLRPSARRSLGMILAESGWPWGLLARDMPRALPALRSLILASNARL